MIIDQTYFVLELNIAQLSNLAVEENLDLFIARYERKFLNEVLGVELRTLVNEFVEGTNTDERIERLVDGYSFTDHGQTVEWLGFRNEEKISPIANYIFFHFAENDRTGQTGIGERKSKGENSESASVDWRIVNAWNEMIELVRPLNLILENGDYAEIQCTKNFDVINRFGL